MQNEFEHPGSSRPRNGSLLTALGCSMVLHVCLLLAFSMQSNQVQSPDPERQNISVTLVAGPEPSPQVNQTRHLPPAANKGKTETVPEPAPPPAAKPTIKLARPEASKAAEAEAARVAKPGFQELAEPASDKLKARERPSAPTNTAAPDDRQNTTAALPVNNETAVEKEGAKTEENRLPPTQATGNAVGKAAAGPSTGKHKLPAGKARTIARAEPSAAIRDAYQEILRQRIERYKTYPPMARRGNQEGTARIFFELDRQGRLTDCRLEQSSGYRLLDRAAMQAVRAGAPFPPLPAELLPQSAQAGFAIPVTFILTR